MSLEDKKKNEDQEINQEREQSQTEDVQDEK